MPSKTYPTYSNGVNEIPKCSYDATVIVKQISWFSIHTLRTLCSTKRLKQNHDYAYGMYYISQALPTWFALSWWRHQMEAFSASLALWAGNSPVPVNFLHKGQWRGAFMFSLIHAWINGWVNNRVAGDLTCHRAMCYFCCFWFVWNHSLLLHRHWENRIPKYQWSNPVNYVTFNQINQHRTNVQPLQTKPCAYIRR